jgi:copper chaperone CopZ
MRFVVYLVAVLAAAGIVYYVSGSGDAPLAQSNPAPAPAAAENADVETADSADVAATELISLKVPGMHCPFACYPSVKKTLESEAGVAEVELAQQKEEGTIDNPVVLIRASDSFDLDKAIEHLASSGFADATVVE